MHEMRDNYVFLDLTPVMNKKKHSGYCAQGRRISRIVSHRPAKVQNGGIDTNIFESYQLSFDKNYHVFKRNLIKAPERHVGFF